MKTIIEILKEVGFPFWIMLGALSFGIAILIICAVKARGKARKSWFEGLPLAGPIFALIMVGTMLYFANKDVKRKKAFDERKAMHLGEMVAIQSSPLMEEEKSVALDKRLQSVEGIIGYLDQSIKMGRAPQDLTPILLFLAKEIKTIRDER